MREATAPRTLDLRVKVTPAEKAQIKAEGQRLQLTVSDLIRERLSLPLRVGEASST